MSSEAEAADSTLKSDMGDEYQPPTVKKKKPNGAISDIYRMPNPLASSSIMISSNTNNNNSKQSTATSKEVAKQQAAITPSGKVKQMVEAVEARIKCTPGNISSTSTSTTTTAASRVVTSTLKKMPTIQAASTAAAAVVTKLRPSIDKKKRVSGSKAEAKRKSTRQVNALLKDINELSGVDQVRRGYFVFNCDLV